MPGSGTHATIIQHLAQENATFMAALGDPTLNANVISYESDAALLSRYAMLGAMGPDIFYAMLDYGADIQAFEDTVIKIAGTLECVGDLSEKINDLINSAGGTITNGVWTSIQDTFGYLSSILKDSILDVLITECNFWQLFLPLRQVDDYRQNWYWADYLHYVKTGCFAQRLLDKCQTFSSDPRTTSFLKAYALGYLTHYVSDTVGHAYVNRIVESPWRNTWQRHHLVENFIDAQIWDHWHNPSAPVPAPSTDEASLDLILDQTTADSPSRQIGDGAPLHYARLNDLCNIGSAAIDVTISNAIASVCNTIENGLFQLGVSSVPDLATPDDPAFVAWTNFMAEAMWEVYPPNPPATPPTLQDHPTKLSRNKIATSVPGVCPDPGGYPSPDDIAGAYGVYRIVLSLATEEDIDPPVFPNISGDISSILAQLQSSIQTALSQNNVPPPPAIPSGGSFSLSSLWDAISSYAGWVAAVGAAVAQAVGEIILAAIEAAAALTGAVITDTIKVGLWALNSALFSLYHTVRMPLVMSAYSVPLTEDLTGSFGPLNLKSLWTPIAAADPKMYPIEPVVSQRDFTPNSKHAPSPYQPFFPPSTLSTLVEQPPTTPPAALLLWSMPNNMLETPIPAGSVPMLSSIGPAPATTVPLHNTDGSLIANLETFDGTKRFFGGVFANCEAALNVAIPYVSGTPMPQGTMLPDYNLDSDRGYAWPSWDVDYASPNPTAKFKWNGCDPFPADTITRVTAPGSVNSILAGTIDWGVPTPPPQSQAQPNLSGTIVAPVLDGSDPFGKPRNGQAFVNAAALSVPGQCGIEPIPFPFIVIDPSMGELASLDPCTSLANPQSPIAGLTFDYQLAPSTFLANDPNDILPTTSATALAPSENDQRVADVLRTQAQLQDAKKILVNAVTMLLNGTNSASVTAVAQLAVTGRNAFESFATLSPQDADLVTWVNQQNPGNTFNATALAAAAHTVLDVAYTTLWTIRGNVPGWRALRSQLGSQLGTLFASPAPTISNWIAVSGFDDTPHRPVNVPTAPYPQFDISFSVTKTDLVTEIPVTTRFLVASAGTFIGPNDSNMSSFTDPDPGILAPPPPSPVSVTPPFSPSPAPRTVPQDQPVIPAGNKIIIYIHGGGSRAEEAVGLANWLIVEGLALGQNYTVVSLDLANSAYGTSFDVTDILVGHTYDNNRLDVRDFEQRYIIAFIMTLQSQLGITDEQIVAVMGGSLGGNMGLLLSSQNGTHPFLDTIVAWSATSLAPSTTFDISNSFVAAYIGGLKTQVTSPEPPTNHAIESAYIDKMYNQPLINEPVLPFIPAQPLTWYRSPTPPAPEPAEPQWAPCKSSLIAQSRFDRYEIYSPTMRHWAIAVDLELITFSFQDNCLYQQISAMSATSTSHLFLAAGDRDNYDPVDIFNSTITVAQLLRHNVRGKAEFWKDTGHSFHDERPHLFAKEIVFFLSNLDADTSPNGTVTNSLQPTIASDTSH